MFPLKNACLPSTDWDRGTYCAAGCGFPLCNPLLLVLQSQTVQIRVIFWAQTCSGNVFYPACKMWPCSNGVNIKDETSLWSDSAVVSYLAFHPGCGLFTSASLKWKKKSHTFSHFCVSFCTGSSGSLSSALLLCPPKPPLVVLHSPCFSETMNVCMLSAFASFFFCHLQCEK